MNILYAVPQLHSPGGIQAFAKAQHHSLRNDLSITLADWQSPTRRRDEHLYTVLPRRMARPLFNHRHQGGLSIPRPVIDTFDLIHFWHIDIAMAYPMIEGGVICCYGLDVLTSRITRYRVPSFLRAMSNASQVAVCSGFTKRYLADHYAIDPTKLTIINPGVDLTRFSPITRPAHQTPIVGTLSRLTSRKNVLNVVRSLDILKRRHGVDFLYYLAGDGPERSHIIQELQRRRINFRYFGRIAEEDKASFYRSLDVFILPPTESRTDVEGFGIVFLEANASGVPVVAADTGGIRDAVNPGVSGLFADPADPADIAESALTLLHAGDQYRLSSRGWAEKFSQQNTASQFQQLYANRHPQDVR